MLTQYLVCPSRVSNDTSANYKTQEILGIHQKLFLQM